MSHDWEAKIKSPPKEEEESLIFKDIIIEFIVPISPQIPPMNRFLLFQKK